MTKYASYLWLDDNFLTAVARTIQYPLAIDRIHDRRVDRQSDVRSDIKGGGPAVSRMSREADSPSTWHLLFWLGHV